MNPNTAALRRLLEDVGSEPRQRLVADVAAEPGELAEYHRLVLYLLFLRYEDAWYKLIEPVQTPKRIDWYESFESAVEYFYSPAPALRQGSERIDAPHLFALGFQARRAFHYIFRQIFGGSLPAAWLRAIVWRAIFTIDMQCYREAGYARMAMFPTLITGATGTGKELALPLGGAPSARVAPGPHPGAFHRTRVASVAGSVKTCAVPRRTGHGRG